MHSRAEGSGHAYTSAARYSPHRRSLKRLSSIGSAQHAINEVESHEGTDSWRGALAEGSEVGRRRGGTEPAWEDGP